LLFVVVHVLSVLWLVSGVVGRDVCWWHAARATDLDALRHIAALAHVFDERAVRPSTFVVLVTGLLAVHMRGYPFLAFMRGEGPAWPFTALLIYLSIVPVIVFVFLPKGRAYREALTEAESRGELTARLRGAIEDPAVRAARGYEMLMIVVLVFLMVAKPF
jgi:p-aminobenzoyl-glutamate transporter AbgT